MQIYISIVDANRNGVESNSQKEHETGPRSVAIYWILNTEI